jgi:arginine utilization protein RocB
VDRWHGWTGAPPVLLRLRDLKPGYDTQTALDAVIELNLLSFARPVEENLSRVRRIVESAARAASERTQAMAGRLGVSARSWPVRVRLASELPPLANDRGAAGADAREATLARIRAAVDALPAEGPVIVIALVPPFYPALAPGRGAFAESTARVLAEEGVEVRPFYPMVSDASYLAWPGPDPGTLAALMPSLGRELRLPIAAMRSLSLDVLNLGPWGAGAHTIAERANAAWTFERLPRVLGRLTRAVLEERNSR